MKTLGVTFDGFLRFEKYWKDTKTKIMKKMYAINQVKSSLTFLQRKLIVNSLILSRVEYCIEATSSCPRSILSIPRRIINRTTRVITNNWNFEDSVSENYITLGWMEIEELVVWRTFKLAKKILLRKNPMKMLRRLAEESDGDWKVKPPEKRRTEVGKRTFSSRVRRLWSILPEEVKHLDINKKSTKKRKLRGL